MTHKNGKDNRTWCSFRSIHRNRNIQNKRFSWTQNEVNFDNGMRAKIKGLPSPRKIALDWMACQECFFIYSWKIFHFLSPSSSSFGGLFFPSENRGNMRPSVSPFMFRVAPFSASFVPPVTHRRGGEGERRVPPLLVALAMRRGGGAEEMDRILDTLRLHLQLWGSFRPLI